MKIEPQTLPELFRDAHQEVYEALEKEKIRAKKTLPPVPEGKLPDCVLYILKELPKTAATTFNKLTINLVTAMQRAGYDLGAALDVTRPFLESYPSSTTYTTSEKRLRHFTQEWGYLGQNPDYRFECSYILGLGFPGSAFECKECTWAEGAKQEASQMPESKVTPLKRAAEKKRARDAMALSNRTDLGNAERLVALHGAEMKFCHSWGKWFLWDGKRWAEDTTGQIRRLAKDTTRRVYAEASEIEEEETRKTLIKWALGSESLNKLKAMIALAESEEGVPILPEKLDEDPWLFNCLDGLIDVRTGEITAHDRARYITKLSPYSLDMGAACPKWKEHLKLVLGGDQELISFLQRAYGSCLTGITDDRKLFILWGGGKNGKSICQEAIAMVLGEYASRTPVETLLVKKGEQIPNDVARLKGARFVQAAEAERGKRLSESLVKDLTGGEKITARFLHKEFFEFHPSFKIFLSTNHRPVIRGTDEAIWDRICLVPFTVRIPDDQQRPKHELMAEFEEEAPGILGWLLQGAFDWHHNGLNPPGKVNAAVKEYRDEMDTMAPFFEEHCIFDETASVTSSELYNRYKEWAEKNGEKRIGQKTLSGLLRERGCSQKRTRSARRWEGIGLIPNP